MLTMCKSKSNDILQWFDLSADIFRRLVVFLLLIWFDLSAWSSLPKGCCSRSFVTSRKWFHLILSIGSSSMMYPAEFRRSSETELETRYHSQLIYSWHPIDRVINQLSLLVFVALLRWMMASICGIWNRKEGVASRRQSLARSPRWFRFAAEVSANIIFIIHGTSRLFSLFLLLGVTRSADKWARERGGELAGSCSVCSSRHRISFPLVRM